MKGLRLSKRFYVRHHHAPHISNSHAILRRRKQLSVSILGPHTSLASSRWTAAATVSSSPSSSPLSLLSERISPKRERRRRFLSSSSGAGHEDDETMEFVVNNKNPRQSLASSRPPPSPDIAVDKFTHFCLNSNMVPLGCMTESVWNDALDAVSTWLFQIDKGRGYAVDSAGRLLDRLWVEHLVLTGYTSFDSTRRRRRHRQPLLPESMMERQDRLVELQRTLFHSWIDCAFATSSLSPGQTTINSQLALQKAEDAFVRLYEILETLPPCSGSTDSGGTFPIDEYLALVEACLQVGERDQVEHEQGVEKAADWLLKYTQALGKDDNMEAATTTSTDMAMFADQIGPLLETCVLQLLTLDPKSQMAMDVLERMNALKDTGKWPNLTLTDKAERILLESSLKRSESIHGNMKDDMTEKAMTPFELEAIERRLIDVLRTSNGENRDEVEELVSRTSNLEPSSSLVLALIDFYVRAEDPEKASFWLQRLDEEILAESSDIVETVLSLWSKQKGPRTPFRVDEVFKAVTNRGQNHQNDTVPITLASSKIVLDVWASSGDPGADRKILDIFSSLLGWKVEPDAAILRTALHAAQKEKSDVSFQLISMEILNRWNSLDYEDKVWLSQEVLAALATIGGEASKSVAALLDRFQEDNIKPTASIYSASLNAIRPGSASASDVWKIIDSFENNLDEVDLSLYALAGEKLFDCDGNASEVERVFDKVLYLFARKDDTFDNDDVSQLLETFVRLHVSRKLFPAAAALVERAEGLLLGGGDPSTHSQHISPIPLQCYKLMIVRKWYTKKTAPVIKHLFNHLKDLFNSGYENLRPDSEIVTGYMRACSTLGEDVEPLLQEMIDLYKSSGDEQLKPSTEAFNIVLLDYSRKDAKVFHSGNKAAQLLRQMLDLGVQPDTKSLNFTLHNLTKGNNQYAFDMVMKLLGDLEERGCKPEADSFTLHYILDACGGDGTTKSETALKKCLSTFREIREKDMIGSTTYGILSKVLYRLLSKGDRADKVAGSILALCCEDGRLSPDVKDRFQSLMSQPAWIVQYERKLSPNGEEPEEWSRLVPIAGYSERVA